MVHFHEEEILGKAYDSRLMKRLLKFIYPYKWTVFAAMTVLLAYAFAEIAGPFLIKIAIDRFIAASHYAGLFRIIIIFFFLLLIQAVLNYFHTFITSWIGQKVMFDIRSQVFSHIQNLPLSFFDKNPVGRLVTRVTNDVETLNEMLSSGIVAIMGDLVVLSGIIIMMLLLNWKMAIITFVVFPFILLTTLVFRYYVRDAYRKIRLRIAKINSFLQENISGMATVQIFNREEENAKRFERLNKEHLHAHLLSIRYHALFFPAISFFSSIAIALIIWYGGGRVVQNLLSIGVLVAFMQYVRRFFEPIRDLADKYNIMQAAMASSERIFKLLDEPQQQKFIGKQISPPPAKGKIEFQNVTFAYNNKDNVLENISFTITPGEKVAIVGATGAGKTTITSLINRLYEPTSGRILLDDVDTSQIDLVDLRSRIGVVLQDVFIFSGTVQHNIALGNTLITTDQIVNAAKRVNAHTFVSRFSDLYHHQLTERGSNLSVGQKQLLAFARALAYDPEILILDEATSSVDTETEQLIQEAINELMSHRTSIIVAHRLSTIKNVDWIIVLHKGKIYESGKHEDLLKQRGLYYRLFQLQFGGMAA